MSGAYPTSPVFNAVGFTSQNFNLQSETISGRIQVRNIGGQRFRFTASYPPLSRSEFGPVNAFVMQQRGGAETFTIVLPEVSSTSGTASGSPTGTGSLGSTSVTVSSLTGTLKAGDVIKFANHSKVYMVVADRSGAGTMTIEPPLKSAVSASAITYNNVPFTVRLASPIQEFDIGVEEFYSYEIDMIEAV